MTDTDPDINTVIERTRSWVRALQAGQLQVLEDVLADEFLLTTNHPVGLGALTKRQVIEVSRRVKDVSIDIKEISAQRAGNMIITRQIAKVVETFTGDLGPGMPSAAEMTQRISGGTFAYASGWKLYSGTWRCFDHHIFGAID